MSQQIKKWIQIVNDPQLNCELNTIHSSLLTDDEMKSSFGTKWHDGL